MFYDIDIKYSNDKYQKVFIPEFITVHKEKLDGYKYIKTIDAGSNSGHILFGEGLYFMCMRKDDYIKVDKGIMEPIGFRRKDIAELERLAATFVSARDRRPIRFDRKESRRKYQLVTVPMHFQTEIRWHIRMEGYFLINNTTGQEIHLGGKSKVDVANEIGVTTHQIDSMISDGIEAHNWCFKGTRLDGLTWEEYFTPRQHHKSRADFNCVKFVGPEGHEVNFLSIRKTAARLGVNYECLRMALINRKDKIGQYTIVRPT